MLKGKVIAVDTETTGLKPWHGDRPFMVSLCNEDGDTAFVRMNVNPKTRVVEAPGPNTAALKDMLADPSVTKVFHNAKFDVRMLGLMGMPVNGPIQETMFASHVMNSVEPHKLKYLAQKYLGIDAADEKELHRATTAARRIGKKLGWALGNETRKMFDGSVKSHALVECDYWMPYAVFKRGLGDASWETVCSRYAVKDAERTMLLWLLYSKAFEQNPSLWKVYQQEMRLWPITYAMEQRGVAINLGMVHETGRKVLKTLLTIKRRLPDINLNSPKQLQDYLFVERGLKPLKFTETKQPSTDKDVLEAYAYKHAFVRDIQTFRDAAKLYGTYLMGYLREAIPGENDLGTIHCSFNQMGPITGRYSCSEPNLQNLTKPSDKIPIAEQRILVLARAPFCPRPDYIWYMFDYEQIEARIFADMAKEESMLADFAAGVDVYQGLADRIAEYIGVDVVRQQAKAIFLGKLYGMWKTKMAMSLGCSLQAAQIIITGFDKRLPRVRGFMQETIRAVKEQGYVETVTGRRIPLGDRDYAAVNHRVQGSAADLLKLAMVKVDRTLKRSKVDGHLIMTIHDELAVEVHRRHASMNLLRALKRAMEDNEGLFRVKTPVEVSRVTTSWLEKKKIAV